MNELDNIRKIPSNIEAEKAVLGGIFLSPDIFQELLEIISPDDFFKKSYSFIFEGMAEIFNSGAEIDPILLKTNLEKKEFFKTSECESVLLDIISSVNSSINLLEYAHLIKEKSILRKLGQIGIKITEMAYRDDRDAEDVLDESEALMLKISEGKNQKNVISMKEAGQSELKRLELMQSNLGELTGITSGFSNFDKMTSGFHNSDLIIVAARPSMGKTAFALNLVLNAANQGKSVLVFSLEMSTSQLFQRLISVSSGVPLKDIKNGFMNGEGWAKLGVATSNLSNLNINIADTPTANVLQIRGISRKIKSQFGLDMIVIDYLQLIKGHGRDLGNKQQEVSEISRSLKGLARELDIPVIALSQLSRGTEKRDDKRPMLSDLRESGAIEQDADIVSFLYRDDYYNPESPEKGITEIIIGKQRNGPVGVVKLKFFPETTKFADFTTKIS